MPCRTGTAQKRRARARTFGEGLPRPSSAAAAAASWGWGGKSTRSTLHCDHAAYRIILVDAHAHASRLRVRIRACARIGWRKRARCRCAVTRAGTAQGAPGGGGRFEEGKGGASAGGWLQWDDHACDHESDSSRWRGWRGEEDATFQPSWYAPDARGCPTATRLPFRSAMLVMAVLD
jgi:hypothetical protein